MTNLLEKLKKYKAIFGLAILFLGILIAMLASNQSKRELNFYKSRTNIPTHIKEKINNLCLGEFKPLLVLNPFKYWKEQSQCWYRQLKIVGFKS